MSKALRFLAVASIAALSSTAAAQAQEAAQQPAAQEEAVDAAALKGQIDSLAEQVAEMKSDVSGLKRLKFSGYVQARYAWLESAVYNNTTPTGDGPANDNFYIRRGRFKAVYDAGWSAYVLQIDAIPSEVGLKEAYATLNLPAGLAVDAGLQLMPFGYEVLVRSSSDLDLLERSQVTRRLLNGEYDLGIALRGAYGVLNYRIGLFNGNGFAGGEGRDNDQLKDVIGRVGFDLGFLTGGVSGWYGKVIDYSSASDVEYDRTRFGADLQLYLDLLPIGGTALKGEYIWGVSRIGDGAGGGGDRLGETTSGWYAILTQNLGPYNQLAVRYDYYIPQVGRSQPVANRAVEDEWAVALHTFIGGNFKLTAAYYMPSNVDEGEGTPAIPELEADQLIIQAQAKF